MAAISAAFVDGTETTPKATDIYSFGKILTLEYLITVFSTEGQIKMSHSIHM